MTSKNLTQNNTQQIFTLIIAKNLTIAIILLTHIPEGLKHIFYDYLQLDLNLLY